MGILDKILLYIALSPAFLYRKLGVNMLHLRAILTAKLTMDNRRVSSINQKRAKVDGKEKRKSSVFLFFGSFLMGLMFLYCFFIAPGMTMQLTLFFSLYIVVLSLFLITDFTTVLIDVRDNQIILPKPVNDSTFVTARLIHIGIRLSLIAIPLVLPSLIAFIIMHPFAALLPFLLMVLISSVVSILLINAVYLIILKITTPEKFQSIISYIQIAFAIVIYGSYQVVPRLGIKANLGAVQLDQLTWPMFFPPYWFAKSCENLSVLNFGGGSSLYILLSLLSPAVSVYLVVKYFAPSFNSKLGLINASAVESSSVKEGATKGLKTRKKFSISERLAGIFTSDGGERAGFMFTWKMMRRSREFKMKVYPSIGYTVVMVVLFFFNSKASLGDIAEMTSKGKLMIIMSIYFFSFVLINAINRLPYSDKYKAAWVFMTTPIERPGVLISGSVKAAILVFYLPLAILMIASGIFIAGYQLLPNIILGCANILTISSLIAFINLRKLPFSESDSNDRQGKNTLKIMSNLLIPAGLGFIHYFIFDKIWVILASTLLAVTISWLIFYSIKKLRWSEIK